jgi:hypothetical protein
VVLQINALLGELVQFLPQMERGVFHEALIPGYHEYMSVYVIILRKIVVKSENLFA